MKINQARTITLHGFGLVKKIKLRGNIICSRKGKHNFNSVDVERELRDDSEKPIFVDIIDNHCYFGELIHNDLCKRRM